MHPSTRLILRRFLGFTCRRIGSVSPVAACRTLCVRRFRTRTCRPFARRAILVIHTLVSLGTLCRHRGLIKSGWTRPADRLTGGVACDRSKLPRCTLYMWNTFTRFEQRSGKTHYGRDMGVIRVGMMWMTEGGKGEGLALAGDIVSEVNKSDNICGRCRKGV